MSKTKKNSIEEDKITYEIMNSLIEASSRLKTIESDIRDALDDLGSLNNYMLDIAVNTRSNRLIGSDKLKNELKRINEFYTEKKL